MRYTILIPLAILTVIVTGCATAQAPAEPKDTSPITIGFIGALTGGAASYGEPTKNAIELSAAKLNEAGGINGRPLEIIYEDGKCNGKDATTAAQKLMNIDKVDVILGGVCSGETLAMAAVTEPREVLIFSPISSSPDITHAGDFVFRNSPSDGDLSSALAQYALKNEFQHAAIIAANTDYAQAFKRVFTEQFQTGGGKVTSEDFPPDERNFQTVITKIKAANPDLIVIDTQSEATAATLIKQIRELGIETQLYGNSVAGFAKSLEAAGAAAEGMVVMDAPGLNKQNTKAIDFLAAYKDAYGELDLEFYAGGAYDSVNILAQAMRDVGTDTKAVRDYLYDLTVFDGVIGKYSFDEYGDIAGIQYVVSVVKDGALAPIE